MSRLRIDPATAAWIRNQVATLKRDHPDIWESGDDKLIADTVEGQTEFNEFLTLLAERIVIAQILADAGPVARKKMIDDLDARLERLERRREWLRKLAFDLMNEAGIKGPVITPTATLSIANGQPKLFLDEDKLPEECFKIKTTRSVDITKIREMLKQGPVSGATLSNAEPHLMVRK